jgi:putative transposase
MRSKDKKEEGENLLSAESSLRTNKADLFQNIAEVSLKVFKELLEDEIKNKAGDKYSHSTEQYDRYGSNPGSIQLGEERVPIRVPRLLNKEEGKTESPEVYREIRKLSAPDEMVLKKIAMGISQKDYEEVTRQLAESFGLSQTTVARKFKQKSREILQDYERRDLGNHDFVALFIDGKYLKREQVVIALGVTITGFKIPLAFIQSTTENSKAIKGLLSNLIQRNFRFEEGILVVSDGSTGLIKAVKETFGSLAVIQRCNWHKRENVISYLNEGQKEVFRSRIQRAYAEATYKEAKQALLDILIELEKINYSAANSLREGLEETLTLHRLGMNQIFGKSFSTTNCIENVNSLLYKYTKKVKRWRNGDMIARWIAVALDLIEPKLQRVKNYRRIKLLRAAIVEEIARKQRKAS